MTALEAERLKEQNPAYEGRPTSHPHFKTTSRQLHDLHHDLQKAASSSL